MGSDFNCKMQIELKRPLEKIKSVNNRALDPDKHETHDLPTQNRQRKM